MKQDTRTEDVAKVLKRHGLGAVVQYVWENADRLYVETLKRDHAPPSGRMLSAEELGDHPLLFVAAYVARLASLVEESGLIAFDGVRPPLTSGASSAHMQISEAAAAILSTGIWEGMDISEAVSLWMGGMGGRPQTTAAPGPTCKRFVEEEVRPFGYPVSPGELVAEKRAALSADAAIERRIAKTRR